MRTLFIWVSVWTLIYVQWRFGLTLNRLFVITFLLGVLASLYSFLWFVGAVFVSMKSPKLLKRPLKYHRKKWFISMLVTAVAFYGFYRTQLPGQFEAYKAIAGEKMEELLDNDKKYVETEEEVITYNTEQREKLIDETSLEAMKMAGNDFNLQEDYQAAIKEALEAAQNEGAVLLAIGSFYLASEILSGGYLT